MGKQVWEMLKEDADFREMWASENFTTDDLVVHFEGQYMPYCEYASDFELGVVVACETLDAEMKRLFLNAKYGDEFDE